MSPPAKKKPSNKSFACYLFIADFLLDLFVDLEDGVYIFLSTEVNHDRHLWADNQTQDFFVEVLATQPLRSVCLHVQLAG
jgi:hypothetical protein